MRTLGTGEAERSCRPLPRAVELTGPRAPRLGARGEGGGQAGAAAGCARDPPPGRLLPASYQRFTDCYERLYQVQPEVTQRIYDKFVTQLQTSVRVSGKERSRGRWLGPSGSSVLRAARVAAVRSLACPRSRPVPCPRAVCPTGSWPPRVPSTWCRARCRGDT